MRIRPPLGGDAPAVVVTGVPWRTGWRYRERGFRHVYWDAGTMLAQLLAVADSAGHAARLHTRFPDAAVAALVGADRVHEWPVAVVSLGDGTPALKATGDAVAGEVDEASVEFPLVTDAQRAGELEVLSRAWGRGVARRADRRADGDAAALTQTTGTKRQVVGCRYVCGVLLCSVADIPSGVSPARTIP